MGKYGQFYDPTSKAKKVLGMALFCARQEAKFKVLTGSIRIVVIFYGLKKGDLDNALKALLDAANGILYVDDKQVSEINAQVLRVNNNPRTNITIQEIG